MNSVDPTSQVNQATPLRAKRKARPIRDLLDLERLLASRTTRLNHVALPPELEVGDDDEDDEDEGVGAGAAVVAGFDGSAFEVESVVEVESDPPLGLEADFSASAPFLYESLR